MDENYHWAFNDVDLCLAIKYNMEKKIIYCGHTNIFHEGSCSLKKNPTNKLFLNHNVRYLLNKWNNRYSLDQLHYTSNNKHNLYKE
jgi:GT2 family glycosyltransferase